MPSYSRALADALRAGVNLVPVLTVDARGTEYHIAPRAFSVQREDDTHVMVRGGLVDVPQLPVIQASIRDASIQVSGVASVVVSAQFLDWAEHIALGFPIQQMRAELSLVPEREVFWEDRIVLYRGMIRSPSWDLRLNEVGFNITNEAPDAVLLIPRTLLSADMITTMPERSAGEVYPILYGAQVYEIAGLAIKEATDDNRLLVAGHYVDSAAGAVTLYAGTENAVTTFTKDAKRGVDEAGNPYTYVILTDIQYWSDQPTNNKPYTFWLDSPGKQGRATGTASGEELRFLGEVMLDILISYSDLSLDRIDTSSFYTVDALFPIEVSIQLTEQKTALEWLEELTDGLPITVAWIGGRLTAKVGAFVEDPKNVAAELRYGYELLELVRSFEETPVEEVVNTAHVRYAYRNRKNRWKSVVRLDRDNDPIANISQRRYGRREQDSAFDLWMIEDDASAFRVASERLARMSQVVVRCAYLGRTEATAHLEPFDIVRVWDKDQGVDGVLFIVEELVPQVDDRMIVALRSRKELIRG